MIQNKFLARDLLEFLDSLANDIYVTNSVKVFPYKSFSETLTLVLISLLRELVHAQPQLAGILINDIQGYIKQVFQSGSEKLSTKAQQEITEKEAEPADQRGLCGHSGVGSQGGDRSVVTTSHQVFSSHCR